MIEIKKVRPGDYILFKDEPYRVIKNQIVVTGTHSHTKNKLDLQGLFNSKYETVVLPPHERLDDVEIVRKRAQLISKQGESAQIMDLVSFETFEAAMNDALKEINEGEEVTYIEFRGMATVLEKR
jgi:translation initiation factor 5A